ncbi:hypothetical protein AGLY_013975 [Aphis glycines]|uniref:Uncharacterized protein n=1 Tax=Aphis glycines TaxID=307491 RepID=A0A6G0T540_APHGL|nr:hypothetical protein AGLY_013975 [Aphis glycines]
MLCHKQYIHRLDVALEYTYCQQPTHFQSCLKLCLLENQRNHNNLNVLDVNNFPIIYNSTQIYLMNLFLLCSTYEWPQDDNKPRCSLSFKDYYYIRLITLYVKFLIQTGISYRGRQKVEVSNYQHLFYKSNKGVQGHKFKIIRIIGINSFPLNVMQHKVDSAESKFDTLHLNHRLKTNNTFTISSH